MLKDLQTVLATQHRLLDSLLLESVSRGDRLQLEVYDAFRETLRQHIALEERLVLKALRDIGFEYALAHRIHTDHGTFGRLIAAPATMENAAEISKLLKGHELLEESDIGLFAVASRTLDDATLKRLVQESSLRRSDSSILSVQPQTREDAFALAAERERAHDEPGD